MAALPRSTLRRGYGSAVTRRVAYPIRVPVEIYPKTGISRGAVSAHGIVRFRDRTIETGSADPPFSCMFARTGAMKIQEGGDEIVVSYNSLDWRRFWSLRRLCSSLSPATISSSARAAPSVSSACWARRAPVLSWRSCSSRMRGFDSRATAGSSHGVAVGRCGSYPARYRSPPFSRCSSSDQSATMNAKPAHYSDDDGR